MKTLIAAVAALSLAAAPAWARTILFVGNSFTFGANSAAKVYRPETVTDLNGPIDGRTIGGVPALFKAMADEAGLDYQVSLETVGGKGLDFHYTQKLPLLDKAWDDVVLQSYSTLDAAHPGDPAIVVKYTRLFADAFTARNPKVKIWLTATWSRPDLTYPPGRPWSGKPIQQMALDVEAGYEAAAKGAPAVTGIAPVGLAFNRAIAAGLADPNPADGLGPGQVDLWSFDDYHASSYGYYLAALMVFGKVTGRDPLSLGDHERAALDLGLSPAQAKALQQIAHDQLAQ
ncbi:MAG: PEP-CTERM sorting domain-containing protein [Proteobacteria bacterium]|nr:PEP-CTERM sorting domain-containing protein [Pseudomonadota bacterium]